MGPARCVGLLLAAGTSCSNTMGIVGLCLEMRRELASLRMRDAAVNAELTNLNASPSAANRRRMSCKSPLSCSSHLLRMNCLIARMQ